MVERVQLPRDLDLVEERSDVQVGGRLPGFAGVGAGGDLGVRVAARAEAEDGEHGERQKGELAQAAEHATRQSIRRRP